MMKKVLPKSLCIGLMVLAVALAGCATTKPTRNVQPTGFLKDYSQLREGEGEEAQLVYINPTAKFADYDKVMLDPITVWRTEGSKLSKIPEEDLEYLISYLYWGIVKELEQDYEVVTRPGPGVMQIRAAITEAKGSKVVMDVVSTINPQMRLLSAGKKLASGTHSFVGKAAIEGEILDSQSKVRLFAAVDERAGGKALKGSTWKWADVEDAYTHWAERLRLRLAELRAGGQ